MRLPLTCRACLVLAMCSASLYGAGILGAPDQNAFRKWRLTLPSQPVISGLAYGQGKWVGVGNGIYYSTNGLTWSQTAVEGDHFWNVIYADGVFVAVGHHTFSIYASTNGIDWQGQYAGPPSFEGFDVAYGNGLFVAGGLGGASFVIATNSASWWTPGQWWTPITNRFSCFGVFFGGGKFVAAGTGPATAVSTNGRDWVVTRHAGTGAPDLMRGTWHNGRYIVVGERGVILVSEDAENWTQRPSPTIHDLWAVAAYNDQYVAVGFEGMLISTNGLDWEEIPLIDPESYFTDIIVADNTFAAVYYAPPVYYSAVYRSDPFNFISPLFRQQPAHTEQRIGLATSFAAVGDGTSPITYQWQKNGVNIPGATSNELAFPKLERMDDAKYRVIARNGLGETTSAEARLTVGLPVRVLTSPTSQSAPAGGAVTFSVEIEGTPPITNKWRKPGSTFVTQVLNDATAFLGVENIQAASAGIYGASLENKYGVTASRGATLTVLTDTDGDGLPDDWETQYGLENPAEDFDNDGLTNLQEYQSGTDPRDAQSYLKIDAIELASGASAVLLRFLARSNHTYTIQARETLSSASWTRVLDVVAASSDRLVTATNEMAGNERYFRLATPRLE